MSEFAAEHSIHDDKQTMIGDPKIDGEVSGSLLIEKKFSENQIHSFSDLGRL